MMSIRAFGDDTLYVSFPSDSKTNNYLIPPEIDKWLREHKIDDWGRIKDVRAGVFLSGEDAVAFKLKFRL
jgi:hypothetical protein